MLISSCFSCNKGNEYDYDYFIFTYSELRSNYSMKFSLSDTIYFDTCGENSGLFYSLIKPKDKQIFNAFVKKIKFDKSDTIYQKNNLFDGRSFQFYKIKNNKANRIFIYGNDAPKEYYKFATFLDSLKNREKLNKLQNDQDWKELKFMIPPPPPSPKIYNSR